MSVWLTYNVDKKDKKIKHVKASQCYYCSNYFIRPDKYDKHIKHRSGILGILYNLDTQNLVTFEDNLKYKWDLPFVAYCDFETTAPTVGQSPEVTKVFPVSCVIIFAFHQDLNLDRIIIELSLWQNFSKPTDVGYWNREMLQYADSATKVQSCDCAVKVSKTSFKQAILEMFATEL